MLNFTEVFGRATKVELAEFGNEFSSFQRSAFRLECLPEYRVAEEAEPYAKYLRGQRDPDPHFNSEWRILIQAASKRNAVFTRVRVVPEPPTEYIKFVYYWGYVGNIAAGEQITAISQSTFAASFNTQHCMDFWLFDDARCYIIEYGDEGDFQGVLHVAQQDISYYIDLLERLISSSSDIGAHFSQ